MSPADSHQRIVIALTESSSTDSLWRAAIEASRDSDSELVALFIDDERWELAASLPFTREISRFGGTPVDFTIQRARAVAAEFLLRRRGEMQRLADEAGVKLVFETLRESDLGGLSAVLGRGRVLLIADAPLASRPVYAQLSRFECRVVIVDGGNHAVPPGQRDTRPA
jgi:hypothetical protein